MTDISKYDDVIDSRDVIARIEELQTEIEDGREAAGSTWDNDDALHATERDAFVAEYVEMNLEDQTAELAVLESLQSEAEGYAPDWRHGATLIRESYFERYCEELCDDIGDLPKDLPNYIVIDWEATARNIKIDYTEVDFDGVPYLVR